MNGDDGEYRFDLNVIFYGTIKAENGQLQNEVNYVISYMKPHQNRGNSPKTDGDYNSYIVQHSIRETFQDASNVPYYSCP